MSDHPPTDDAYLQLTALAREIYTHLASRFPVCLSSDEFHFFPQFKALDIETALWDDFTDDSVASFLAETSRWQEQLRKLKTPSLRLDIDMLSQVLLTLEEQLDLVRPHKTQPTFILTIVSIGLAEALEQSRDLFQRRIEALPGFLSAAGRALTRVPELFAALAVQMLSRLVDWMMVLPMTDVERNCALGSLDGFRRHMLDIGTVRDFRLDRALYARVADVHIGCRMDLETIARHLEDEIDSAGRQLNQWAHRLMPNATWQSAFHALPSPTAPNGDAAAFYQDCINRLKTHCLENGFFQVHAVDGCDIEIQTIAAHMAPVRANAAYSMPPGHPPCGGTFYIAATPGAPLPRDMAMLAAHETFPGHHLLDTLRWQLVHVQRRSLEFPLFYEGWASFSEEILIDTGMFCAPADRLCIAKRRFWRAHRGLAELRLHTGQCSAAAAADQLAGTGLVNRDQALAMVRRYALKPGYQLSYAIGRRKFEKLYRTYRATGRTPGQFAREALSEGEINFEQLSRHLLGE